MNLLSMFRKKSPEAIVDGALADRLDRLEELAEVHQGDLTEFSTAINRIERKQNRWLEVLNLKDKDPERLAEALASTDGPRGEVPVGQTVHQYQAGEPMEL